MGAALETEVDGGTGDGPFEHAATAMETSRTTTDEIGVRLR
jgi:hypothetical protein